MMADILNPWIELDTDIVSPTSFSSHFPLPLQEVKVEIEDSETSASSYRESGDLSHGQTTYISLDSYEQISSPRSSYSQESLSPATTNSDSSVTSPRFINSSSVLPESTSPDKFQYSPTLRPEQSRTPSEFLNPLSQSMEDYGHHSSTISFPGTLGLNGFQSDFLHPDVNHSLYTHWPITNNALENRDSRSTPEQLRTYRSEQLLDRRTSRECVNCGASSALLWWQDETGHFLCNSCSQSIKASPDNTLMFKDNRKSQKRTATAKRTSMICTNCKADKTSLWRRNNLGQTVCNACGLYYKLHKCNRPMTMKKDCIQKRRRKPKASEEKSKGRNNRPAKEIKLENGVTGLQTNTDVILKQEPVDPPFSSASSQNFHSGHQTVLQTAPSDYASSIRLLPPVYSQDGFRSSLSPPGSYFPSSYMSISSLSSIPGVENLPSVDIFQARGDYPTTHPQSSILSAMSS